MRWLMLFAVAVALAGCGSQRHSTTATATVDTSGGKTVSGVDIDTAGFKGSVAIPGLSVAGEHMDMDGIRLYPGSTVRGVRVNATDRDGDSTGVVTTEFTSPAGAAKVADQMAAQARAAGFTVSAASSAGFSGSKEDGEKNDRVVVALTDAGSATTGRMTITDGREKSDR